MKVQRKRKWCVTVNLTTGIMYHPYNFMGIMSKELRKFSPKKVALQAYLVSRLGDGDHVHESNRVLGVKTGTVVNLNQTLLGDHHGLTTGQGVVQTVPQHQDEGEGLTAL